MSSPFRDDVASRCFELDVNGQTVIATYQRREADLLITYVEAPQPLRGTGAAGELMRSVAETARAEGRKITPMCGYARTWLRRHKEYHDLLN